MACTFATHRGQEANDKARAFLRKRRNETKEKSEGNIMGVVENTIRREEKKQR